MVLHNCMHFLSKWKAQLPGGVVMVCSAEIPSVGSLSCIFGVAYMMLWIYLENCFGVDLS